MSTTNDKNNASTPELLADILAMTREMLVCCEQQHWEALADIETSKRPLLDELAIICTTREGLVSVGHRSLQELLDLENKLLHLCKHEKISCREKLSHLNKGMAATSAYHSMA